MSGQCILHECNFLSGEIEYMKRQADDRDLAVQRLEETVRETSRRILRVRRRNEHQHCCCQIVWSLCEDARFFE